eukprot:IDg21938t1
MNMTLLFPGSIASARLLRVLAFKQPCTLDAQKASSNSNSLWDVCGDAFRMSRMGFMLAEFPYRKRETAYRRGSLLHALWSAFHTQWMCNVAFELLRSATHRGHRGRLWRLSPTLLGAMETVGLDVLMCRDPDLEKKLKELISWNHWINWRLVDPEFSTRPRRNDNSAPLYNCGDFVFFDAVRWAPEVPSRMLESWEPFNREEVLLGDLSMDRDEHIGRGRPTEVFKGIRKTNMVDEYKNERLSENIAKTNVVDEDEGEQSSEDIVQSRKRRRVEEEQENQPMVDVLPARGQERPLED